MKKLIAFWQPLSVAIAAALQTVGAVGATVPTLAISDVTFSTARASWTECEGVSSYTLQMSVAGMQDYDDPFASETTSIFENDATNPSDAPEYWAYNLGVTNTSYLLLLAGNEVISEPFDSWPWLDYSHFEFSLTVSARRYGIVSGASNLILVQYSAEGCDWRDLCTITPASTQWEEYTFELSSLPEGSDVRLRFIAPNATANKGAGIRGIIVRRTRTCVTTVTVTGTSFLLTSSLAPGKWNSDWVPIYVRVRGNAGWSPVVSFFPVSTAPVWATLPTPILALRDCWTFCPSNYVDGDPLWSVELTDGTALPGEFSFQNGQLRYCPETTGTFQFQFSAQGWDSYIPATLTVNVVELPPSVGYGEWLEQNGLDSSTSTSATNAISGQTYGWHYVADIAPDTSDLLAISFSNTTSSVDSFTIDNASPNRYYQLVYSTNLVSGFITNDIGRGYDGMTVPFPSTDNWYGHIRVLPSNP